MPIHDLAKDPERSLAALVRTEPIQERSAARVDALLDAAAAVVDEIGFDRLTTAMVAERADASIGTVYRYFPDRIALLQGLRERAIGRFRVAVVQRIEEVHPSTWLEAVECSIDAVATMYRTEPGFRIIRFADDERGNDATGEFSGDTVPLSHGLAEVLSGDFGLPAGDELVFRVAIAIEIGDALVGRAFVSNPEGEERYITEARAVISAYLSNYYS
ncbi:TetR/AcrR family transcriptional regulator [Gryllotalpicola protaetiae]|uniref:TetR/AcrR family transcriptional regulator n=1 Tax=Gryllotalpicola protaetiae TaxID=2419771 RepID=A0A387BLR7_9MICO|nr:TetR/AcrR family transcriptional regulator [Gryllotalpicola protaetiae]AYG05105.1 TetR/AcrR family transcriptional regulator [Gryllotalpicola protaetiae]